MKRNRPSSALGLGPLQPRRSSHALEHRAARVELGLVLREVRGHDAVAEPELARRRLAAAEQRFEERRLA